MLLLFRQKFSISMLLFEKHMNESTCTKTAFVVAHLHVLFNHFYGYFFLYCKIIFCLKNLFMADYCLQYFNFFLYSKTEYEGIA